VDHHGRLAEYEGAVIECAQLHGVLDQAGAGGETGPGERLHTRVVFTQSAIDAVKVRSELLGHDVELVGDGEVDIAPGVTEKLGQLRLDRLQEYDFGAQVAEEHGGPLRRLRRGAAYELRELLQLDE